MTILNIVNDYGRNTDPGAFMINYTDEEEERLRELHHKHNDGMYMEGSTDQCMVMMYDALPSRVKKKLNVDEMTMHDEVYQKGGWKVLCRKGFHPRKYYDDNNKEFFQFDKYQWISVSENMPEVIMEKYDASSINNSDDVNNDGKNDESIFMNMSLQCVTDKVLAARNNHTTIITRRVCIDGIWSWESKDKIIAWMKLPKY